MLILVEHETSFYFDSFDIREEFQFHSQLS